MTGASLMASGRVPNMREILFNMVPFRPVSPRSARPITVGTQADRPCRSLGVTCDRKKPAAERPTSGPVLGLLLWYPDACCGQAKSLQRSTTAGSGAPGRVVDVGPKYRRGGLRGLAAEKLCNTPIATDLTVPAVDVTWYNCTEHARGGR